MFTGNANSLTVTNLATIKNCKIDNSLYFKTDTHTYTYDKESWEPDPTTAIWIANGAGGQKNISVPTGLPIGTVRWAISNGTSGKFGIQSAGNDKFVSEGRDRGWLVMDNAGDSVMLVKISSYQWACFPTIFTKGSFGDN